MTYNPNETRDWHGRWTRIGDSNSLSPASISPEQILWHIAAIRSGPPNHDGIRPDGKSKILRITVTPDGQTVMISYADGTTEIREGGSRSWRNNNPGNIVCSPTTPGHGAIGCNHGFAVFPDLQTGVAAGTAYLKEHPDVSIDERIKGWAPPNKNDVTAYQKFIHQFTGLPGDTRVGSLSDQQVSRLLMGITKFEGFKPGTVTRAREA
jgi:hypothetical protein